MPSEPTIPNSPLAGRRVLVTGGTGFIGGRVAEKLVLEHGARVRVLARDYGRAVRVARLPIELVSGSALDEVALDRAVDGCDAVVHAAHDFGDEWANVPAARALAEAVMRHGAERLVYVSSVSVHEPVPAEGVLDEESPTPAGFRYAAVKLAIEQEMERARREQGLPSVVVRPTIVYGPYSPPWTLQPIGALRSSRVVLPAMGQGHSWAVYVDDVADAIIAALARPEAVGERFLVSGPDQVTWSDFFGSYERALGLHSLLPMETEDVLRAQSPAGVVVSPSALLRTPLARGGIQVAKRVVGYQRWRGMRDRMQPLQFPATREQTALYATKATVDISKARRLLGYAPQFDLQRGMAITSDYLHWSQFDQPWA